MPRTKLFDEKQVLENAMELFWKKGFHATSIQDLVDHLGVNRGSLYDTFGGKQELYDRAFSIYVGNSSRFITEFLNGHDSVKEGIRKLFETSIDSSTSDPESKGCFIVNATTELSHLDEGMKSRLGGNKDRFEKIFFNYLKKGVATGEIDTEKDIEAIAALLFTLYNGIMVIAKVSNERDKLMQTIDTGLAILD